MRPPFSPHRSGWGAGCASRCSRPWRQERRWSRRPGRWEDWRSWNGDQVLLAESDQEFAAAIIGLFREPARRVELARRARELAAANLGQESVTLAFEQLYASLLR